MPELTTEVFDALALKITKALAAEDVTRAQAMEVAANAIGVLYQDDWTTAEFRRRVRGTDAAAP